MDFVAEAHHQRGLIHLKKGEYDKAIENFSKAIEINPKYAEAYNNRGLAYEKLGDTQNSIADYSKAVEFSEHQEVGQKKAFASRASKSKPSQASGFDKIVLTWISQMTAVRDHRGRILYEFYHK